MLLALLGLQPVSYKLPENVTQKYQIDVMFEGLIPILGGQQGKAEVKMEVGVEGLSADKDKNPRAASELKKAEMLFNGAKLPLSLDNVKEFFPRTTISFTPEGKIVATDAPDRTMPVKLPGLDAKRFPDISYMPVEFPKDGIELGTKWTYSKNFGGSPVNYECEVTAIDSKTATISLKLKQIYEVLEDSAMEVVTDPADAENKVVTEMVGTGKVVFDLSGQVNTGEVRATALSKVTPVAGGETTDRKLALAFTVKRIIPETKTR